MNSQAPIDISVTLGPTLPTWPGSMGVQVQSLQTIGPDSDANVSRLDMDVHTGTHLDAPLHFVADGADTTSLSLTTLVGSCRVVSIPNTDTITRELLERYVGHDVPNRLLLRTDNSRTQWYEKPFQQSFTALAADAAEWLVDNQVEVIGIDYLSIQRYADSPATHQILLRNQVVILEGIYLGNVEPGTYQLVCLPLKVQGLEGVPCRAVLYQN
ncbi:MULTISPECIES: cyclase family protein [Spirosoma]|uniref:Cyclase family protein n=1 Tax=Spirosoma liriopis TaxID=2937440 RepID=A0ABT0HKS8_9BACT|nr:MULTISPECIES: cyclase family protein [Spirosoma]MCK8492781.1 cyclase family protein [Spirosoma liriopis]UHG92245.1 cyclase family protein [Spirosoma oryzicola]